MNPLSLIGGVIGSGLSFFTAQSQIKAQKKIAETNAIKSAAIASNVSGTVQNVIVVLAVALGTYGVVKGFKALVG